MKQGTPKTLHEAVKNGLDKYAQDVVAGKNVSRADMVYMVEVHIRDFLAQRFGAAVLHAENVCMKGEADRLMDLYTDVTAEPMPKPPKVTP